MLLANSAYAQATILWITMTPLLYKFNSYCEVRYGSAVRHMPLETAAAAPAASIPAVVYMPPALRKGAAGWYPEFGKVGLSQSHSALPKAQPDLLCVARAGLKMPSISGGLDPQHFCLWLDALVPRISKCKQNAAASSLSQGTVDAQFMRHASLISKIYASMLIIRNTRTSSSPHRTLRS